MSTTEQLRELLAKRKNAEHLWKCKPQSRASMQHYDKADMKLMHDAVKALPALLDVVDATRHRHAAKIYTEEWQRAYVEVDDALIKLDQVQP